MMDEENAHYFVYDGIPISVGIVNDAVGINERPGVPTVVTLWIRLRGPCC